jgi:hypothetical protein
MKKSLFDLRGEREEHRSGGTIVGPLYGQGANEIAYELIVAMRGEQIVPRVRNGHLEQEVTVLYRNHLSDVFSKVYIY